MSFQSLDTQVARQQLLVQNLVVRFSDANLYSVSGNVVTVQLNEQITAIYSVIRCKNATPSVELVANANCVINNSTPGAESVACTLASAFAANDCLILNYSISQTSL